MTKQTTKKAMTAVLSLALMAISLGAFARGGDGGDPQCTGLKQVSHQQESSKEGGGKNGGDGTDPR